VEELATPPPKVNLRSLAIDIVSGKIFGSWQLANPDIELKLVFIVLVFCKKEDIPEDVYVVYDYIANAGPGAINGLPIFYSCYFLSKKDFEEVSGYVEEIKKFKQSFLQDNDEKSKTTPAGCAESVGATGELDSRNSSVESISNCSGSSDDTTSSRLNKLFKRKSPGSDFTFKTWT
jgi:hypothetical protein